MEYDDKAYVLTTNGKLREWGSKENGGWRETSHNDRLVSNEFLQDNITSVVSGMGHHVAINKDGQVFDWGIKVTPAPEGADYPDTWCYNKKPQLVRGLRGIQIKQIGVG